MSAVHPIFKKVKSPKIKMRHNLQTTSTLGISPLIPSAFLHHATLCLFFFLLLKTILKINFPCYMPIIAGSMSFFSRKIFTRFILYLVESRVKSSEREKSPRACCGHRKTFVFVLHNSDVFSCLSRGGLCVIAAFWAAWGTAPSLLLTLSFSN